MAVASEANTLNTHDEPAAGIMHTSTGRGGSGDAIDIDEKPWSVAFKEDPPDVREVEFDEEEMSARWYSTGEYFFIKKEALCLCRRMCTTNIEDTDTLSTRGLEIVDDSQVKQRKKMIDNVVKCVLEEQQRNGSDPDSLAPLYQELSQSCKRRSIENAINDHKDAECYLADTKKRLSAKNNTQPKMKGCLPSLFRKIARWNIR
jgi:hypothetical protein